MGKLIVNGDRFEISQFKNFIWKKETDIKTLPEELLKYDGVCENIKKNGKWYSSDNTDYTFFAFFANIGKTEHPLINNPCICTWYNTDSGGVYITGREKNTGAFFAPILN